MRVELPLASVPPGSRQLVRADVLEIVRTVGELRARLAVQLEADGPSLLLVETAPEIGRPAPRIALTPAEITARMRAALSIAEGAR